MVYLSYISAFFATLLACVLLGKLFSSVAWLDCASGHKCHQGAVPAVGGLAMWLGLLAAYGCFFLPVDALRTYLGLSFFMMMVGLVDDRIVLSANLRFMLQMLCVYLMVAKGGVVLHSFGNFLGLGEVVTHRWALAATGVAVIAVINAFNMLDGVDGLLGGYLVVVFSGLALMLYSHAAPLWMLQCVVVMVLIVLAFLCCNASFKLSIFPRIFMGDAGSTMWGFLMAWWCIKLSQHPYQLLRPVACLWFVALPLWDCARLMLLRLLKRRSMITADRSHVHHLLLALGLSETKVCMVLWSFAALCVLCGLYVDMVQVKEVYVFSSFIISFIFYCMVLVFLEFKVLGFNIGEGNYE